MFYYIFESETQRQVSLSLQKHSLLQLIRIFWYFRYKEEFPYTLESLSQEIDWIEDRLDLSKCDVVLCHNDFWIPNIMYDEKNGNYVIQTLLI